MPNIPLSSISDVRVSGPAKALFAAAILAGGVVTALFPLGPARIPVFLLAGVAIGADGLLVEVHPAPEKAISDGAQSLDLAQFQKMMQDLKPYIQLWQEARKKEVAAAATS